jgi:hypothetical protein
MKKIITKEKWSGFFTYEIYDSNLEVPFYIDIEVSENSFKGVSSNTEIENLFTDPIIVQGFKEGDLVSFTIRYPNLYYLNENDEIVVDRYSSHPDIQYLGYLDATEKKIIGNWEMTVNREKDLNDNILEIQGGTFELTKEI